MHSKFVDVFPELLKYKLIIWDFDGVIKESVQVKADAYAALFNAYGIEVQKKVREHLFGL